MLLAPDNGFHAVMAGVMKVASDNTFEIVKAVTSH
jgi:hypothetical protein